jgi:hypothetical protein
MTILEEIASKRGQSEAAAAARLFAWAEKRGDLRLWFGSGGRWGSFQAGLDNKTGYLFPFALYTNGRIEVQFMWMLRRPPFDSLEKRKELQAKLNAIPGIHIPDDALEKKPPLPLSALQGEAEAIAFLAAMDWAIAEVQAVSTPPGE